MSLTLAHIRGQERVLTELRSRLHAQRLQGSLLFVGPAGVGKQTTATALAMALLCAEAQQQGCGQCFTCQQISEQQHPDVRQLDVEADQRIKIETIRELLYALRLRPVQQQSIAIIPHSEQLTHEAANALLKNLEEGSTLFILLSSQPEALLPTIRSRCQVLRFQPLEPELMRELLTAEELALNTSTLNWAEGSLQQARVLNKVLTAWPQGLSTLWQALSQKDFAKFQALLEDIPENRSEQQALLLALRAYGRDLVLASLEQASPAHGDWERLGKQASEPLLARIDAIGVAEQALQHLLNVPVIWENLHFQFSK